MTIVMFLLGVAIFWGMVYFWSWPMALLIACVVIPIIRWVVNRMIFGAPDPWIAEQQARFDERMAKYDKLAAPDVAKWSAMRDARNEQQTDEADPSVTRDAGRPR